MIIGWSKNFGTTPEHVLWDMSYLNCIMYTSATPMYGDKEEKWDERLDANNPDNFKDNDEEEFVR